MEKSELEKIEFNYDYVIKEEKLLETLVIHMGKVYFHLISIEEVADYIEDKREEDLIDPRDLSEFVDRIITLTYQKLESYAKRKNLEVCSYSQLERQIMYKLSIRTHSVINKWMDELINQTLDDLQNPANENPLNIK